MKRMQSAAPVAASGAISLLLGGLGSAGAAAQELTGYRVLEEVVVTAERRETSLQETPLAVTALSSDMLVQANVVNFQDLADLAPGLSIGGTAGQGAAPVAIRGVSSQAIGIGADEAVAVYVDGVYVGRPSGFTFDLVNIERVEILRGPQGTLYGRNATGGAINILSAMPDEDFDFTATVEAGNFDTTRGLVSVGGQLAQDLFGSFSASYRDRSEGFQTNTFDGSDTNRSEQLALRGVLRGTPSEQLDWMLVADYVDHDYGEPLKATGEVGGPDPGIGDPDRVANNVIPDSTTENGGISLKVDYAFDEVTLTSITGYRELEAISLIDPDGTASSVLRNDNGVEQDQFSQEFQLSSAGDGSLQWMLGAFYYMEDAEEYAAINVFGAGLFIDAVATNKTEGYALFAHGSYALSDALTFTAGIRYSDEEKDFTLVETLDFGGFQVGPFPFSASDSWSSTTPKFVLDYKVTDDLMLYASAAAGFKSGGYNVSLAQSSFDPEKSWNYEAGFKSQWAGNRLRLNGAMFYTDYEDMQVRVPLGPGFIEVQNAAEATMKGAELEFTAQATPALEISGFVSYLDAEYSEYLQDVFDPLTGDVVDTIDLSGNKTNRAPEWQFRISAGYTWSLESGAEVVLRGSYKWQDDEFYSPENEPTLGHSGYELVSGRVTYTHSDGKWQLYAFGDNLTDERFRSTAFAINGQAIAAISDPLVWGVGFKWMGE